VLGFGHVSAAPKEVKASRACRPAATKPGDEILRGGEGSSIEGGDPAREASDEAVQFGVWKCRLT